MQSSHFENLSIAPSSRVSTLSMGQRVDATVLFSGILLAMANVHGK